MYDWIKVLVPQKYWESLQHHNAYNGLIDEYREEDKGEVRIESKYYNGIKVCFKRNKRIELSGSFHYFKNGGKHNANDFKLSDFKEVLKELGSLFGIDWQECEVLNFEFGVNIVPPILSKEILLGCYRCVKKPFNSESGGYFLTVELDRYFLKIYDKKYWCKRHCVNYALNTELLRVEIKTRKKQKGKDFGGVVFITDLLKPKVYNGLIKILIDVIKKIVFYDRTINIQKVLKDKPHSVILKLKDPTNWEDLIPLELSSKKEQNSKGMKYKRWQKELRLLASIYGLNIQGNLINLICLKWSQLTEIEISRCTQINQELVMVDVPKLTS